MVVGTTTTTTTTTTTSTTIFFLMKPTDALIFQICFCLETLTCFGQFLCSSSGVFHCTFGTGICHAGLTTAFKHDQDVIIVIQLLLLLLLVVVLVITIIISCSNCSSGGGSSTSSSSSRLSNISSSILRSCDRVS